jgi:ABC-2 type transport system ATP-binding protein
LYLDEPTIGLDVLAQNTIRKFLAEYVKEHQPTIILTSHYMDDISRLADRLLLISQGSIVYDGTVDNFVAHAEKNLNLDVKSEETDFEEVIHKFFEKESRGGSSRRPVST